MGRACIFGRQENIFHGQSLAKGQQFTNLIYFKAMCTKSPGWQSRPHGVISWICRGRFGIIQLNCTGNERNRTAQTLHSCCEATVNDRGKDETYRRGKVEICMRYRSVFVINLI